jgi:hypothetical protein
MKMIAAWKHEVEECDNMLIENLTDYWISLTGYKPIEERIMRSYYNRFGYDEVYVAIGIAVDTYFKDDINSANTAYTKIGGICSNRKKQREHDAEQDN